MSYLIVFISAFGSATFLPFYSEITLIYYLNQGNLPLFLGMSATFGNTLGGLINWSMGRFLTQLENRRWLLLKKEHLDKSRQWFQNYGKWSVLFVWLPFGGDAICLIAGIMRVNFVFFILVTGIARGIRYVAIIQFFSHT